MDDLNYITDWCNRIRKREMTMTSALALHWLEDYVAEITRLRAEVERLKIRAHEMPVDEIEDHFADLERQIKELVGRKQIKMDEREYHVERLQAIKGCQCICHEFPEHGKLQDALEANRFHSQQIGKLKLALDIKSKERDVAYETSLDLERWLASRCGCQFQDNKPLIECGYHQGQLVAAAMRAECKQSLERRAEIVRLLEIAKCPIAPV
jgi:hypothetical protein